MRKGTSLGERTAASASNSLNPAGREIVSSEHPGRITSSNLYEEQHSAVRGRSTPSLAPSSSASFNSTIDSPIKGRGGSGTMISHGQNLTLDLQNDLTRSLDASESEDNLDIAYEQVGDGSGEEREEIEEEEMKADDHESSLNFDEDHEPRDGKWEELEEYVEGRDEFTQPEQEFSEEDGDSDGEKVRKEPQHLQNEGTWELDISDEELREETAGADSKEFFEINETLRLTGISMTVAEKTTEIESALDKLSSEVTRFANTAGRLSMHSYEALATDIIKSCMDWTPVLYDIVVLKGYLVIEVHGLLKFFCKQLLRLDEIIREIKPIEEIVRDVEIGVKLLDNGKLIKEWKYVQFEETFGILVWVWRDLLITLLVSGKGSGEILDKVMSMLQEVKEVLPFFSFNQITGKMKLSLWDLFLEGGQVNRSTQSKKVGFGSKSLRTHTEKLKSIYYRVRLREFGQEVSFDCFNRIAKIFPDSKEEMFKIAAEMHSKPGPDGKSKLTKTQLYALVDIYTYENAGLQLAKLFMSPVGIETFPMGTAARLSSYAYFVGSEIPRDVKWAKDEITKEWNSVLQNVLAAILEVFPNYLIASKHLGNNKAALLAAFSIKNETQARTILRAFQNEALSSAGTNRGRKARGKRNDDTSLYWQVARYNMVFVKWKGSERDRDRFMETLEAATKLALGIITDKKIGIVAIRALKNCCDNTTNSGSSLRELFTHIRSNTISAELFGNDVDDPGMSPTSPETPASRKISNPRESKTGRKNTGSASKETPKNKSGDKRKRR
ncbi:hypothetical protein RUND412_010954 [Rhizina undulata]